MSPDELRAELSAQSIPIPYCGCVIWLGRMRPNGYGTFSYRGINRGVHRIAYELESGPIPDGLQIDHLCRVRSCINPAHLEPVTNAENTRRGLRPIQLKEARERATHCRNGHEFTPDNIVRIGPGAWRRCRICHYDSRNRSMKRGIYAEVAEPKVRVYPTHCSQGHEMTDQNTYVDPSGARACRICRRAASLRYVTAKRLKKRLNTQGHHNA